jgi:two-component system chemotaxis response regulator CheY
MLSQIQDMLLLTLLPLVGVVTGYLLAQRRHGTGRRSEPVAMEPALAEPATPAPWHPLTAAIKATSRLLTGPVLPPAADLLLVDDSAVARTKLRRLFEAAGYQVHLACDGLEALALLEKGRYAMMITDLEMPNMDGVTLINTWLDRPHVVRMPILAISGHEGLRAKFNECRNIAGVHRKPWVDDILLSHVATLVSARRVRMEAMA